MPIYEYGCPECGHEFSKLQKVSADPPPCPECGHDDVGKKVSKTSFQLKGGGWYVTDFASGGPGAAKKPESSEKSESSSAKETAPAEKAPAKTESKPAAKPAKKAAGSSDAA